jgi:hypothetical protein
MANEVTTNIGMELPTPGVTGALGVEIPGASWMELQNEAFRKVDAHNHGGAGGAPIDASALLIAADVSFNGYRAIDLGSAQFIAGAATAAARSIFFYNGDFWISNGSAVPVRLTNGASIAAAAGNITGLSGSAAITWNSGLGVFIFESTSGTKAGIYCGPLSIFEPVSGGKKATISVPAGLAADYSITLPSALPATTKVLTMSTSGVITPSDAFVDNATIQSVAGILSVKDLGITQAKLAAKSMVSSTANGGQFETGTTYVDVTNITLSFTATGTRPVVLVLVPDGTLPGQMGAEAGISTFRFMRDAVVISEFVCQAPGAALHYATLSNPLCFDAPVAGAHTYKLQMKSGGSGATAYFQNMKLVAYEL